MFSRRISKKKKDMSFRYTACVYGYVYQFMTKVFIFFLFLDFVRQQSLYMKVKHKNEKEKCAYLCVI